MAMSSSHAIAPVKRGKATVAAHGTVDTSASAIQAPVPYTAFPAPVPSPNTARAATRWTTTPGRTETPQCVAAIPVRPNPPVSSRS
ncbi:hypothetical protein D3C83_59600 [compost metagenome]